MKFDLHNGDLKAVCYWLEMNFRRGRDFKDGIDPDIISRVEIFISGKEDIVRQNLPYLREVVLSGYYSMFGKIKKKLFGVSMVDILYSRVVLFNFIKIYRGEISDDNFSIQIHRDLLFVILLINIRSVAYWNIATPLLPESYTNSRQHQH